MPLFQVLCLINNSVSPLPSYMNSEVSHLAVFLSHLTQIMSPQLFLAIHMFTGCFFAYMKYLVWAPPILIHIRYEHKF